MTKKVAIPKKPTPKEKKAPMVDWKLVGPCQICVSPVFYAFTANNEKVHVWRTCDHNKPPQFTGSGGSEQTSGVSPAPEMAPPEAANG